MQIESIKVGDSVDVTLQWGDVVSGVVDFVGSSMLSVNTHGIRVDYIRSVAIAKDSYEPAFKIKFKVP